jgi:hypothetical protein
VEPATHVTAAKTATATRKSGTPTCGHCNHGGCGDCENFAVNLSFHDLAPSSLVSNQIWAS